MMFDAPVGAALGAAAPVVAFNTAAADELEVALAGLRTRLAAFSLTELGSAAYAQVDWRGPQHVEFEADGQRLRAELRVAMAAVDAQVRALDVARQSAATRQAGLTNLHELWTQDCLRAAFLHQPLPPYPDLPI